MSLPSYPNTIDFGSIKSFFGATANDVNSYHSGAGQVPPGVAGYPGNGGAVTIPSSGQITFDNFHAVGLVYEILTGINRLYGNQSNDGWGICISFDQNGLCIDGGCYGSTGWPNLQYQYGASSYIYGYDVYGNPLYTGYTNYAWVQWQKLQQNQWVYTTNQLRTYYAWYPYAWNYTFGAGPLAGTTAYFPSGCFFAAWLSGRTVFVAFNQNRGSIGDSGAQYANGQIGASFNDICYARIYSYDVYGNPLYTSDFYFAIGF